ncbi:Uncharacterised protein [Mycobacteroides abscessus subsp. abscessus]|nr:Uncharacterised protein [Mycobacteroides abscessus subsp. abscessus]
MPATRSTSPTLERVLVLVSTFVDLCVTFTYIGVAVDENGPGGGIHVWPTGWRNSMLLNSFRKINR